MLYKEQYKLSSDYGDRKLGNGDARNHYGLDLVGINNKNIISPISGTVITSTIITEKSNLTWEWGNYIRIDSEDGYQHYFCHLSNRKVNKGEKVLIGDCIGVEGNTGYSFGSHCHYGIRNSRGEWVNPQTYYRLNLREGNTYGMKKENKYKYTETINGTRQIYMSVKDLKIDVFDNKISNNSLNYQYAVNGTLFGGTTFSVTPLMVNGNYNKKCRWGSNHEKAQSCIIIYDNNTVEMRKLKNISELGAKLYSAKHIIGGIGLINTEDKSFKYDPVSEGYTNKTELAGLERKCNKTVLAYIKETNEIVLMTRPNIHHTKSYSLTQLCEDCGYTYAISLDGGGSTFMIANSEYKLKGDGRGIYTVLYCE